MAARAHPLFGRPPERGGSLKAERTRRWIDALDAREAALRRKLSNMPAASAASAAGRERSAPPQPNHRHPAFHPMDAELDAQATALVQTSLAHKKGGRTGFNHWLRFRKIRDKHPRLDLTDFNESAAEIVRFVVYLLPTETRITKPDVITQYISHVRQAHYESVMQLDAGTATTWPSTENNDKLDITIRAAKSHLSRELRCAGGGGRTALTPGIMQMFVHGATLPDGRRIGGTLDLNRHTDELVWLAQLLTSLTGARLGELLAGAVHADKRNTKKDLLDGHITITASGTLEASVLGKNGRRQMVFTSKAEFHPLVREFGPHWDVVAIAKRVMHRNLSRPGTLLFRHADGDPFTYAQYMDRLRQICADARIPSGAIGGHSGRIYMASFMAFNNASVATIKSRGRWTSDCWKIYARCVRPSRRGAARFRAGDLNINLSGFPDVAEFRRR